jgi:hypothetical protein
MSAVFPGPFPIVYVVYLELFNNDQKRPDSSVSTLGLFTDKILAYKTAWLIEIEKNERMFDLPFDKQTQYIAYRYRYHEVETMKTAADLDKLLAVMEDDRDEFLKTTEDHYKATGYRSTVQTKMITDNLPIVDQELSSRVLKTQKKRKTT